MNLTNYTDVFTLTILESPSSPQIGFHSPSPMPSPGRILLAILLLITMVVALAGNTIVCWIVYRKPAMRSAINLLLANLALTDICLPALYAPVSVVSLLMGRWMFGDKVCVISGLIHSILNYVGIYILLAISLDRYLIIVHHKEKLTVFRAKIIILLSWVVSCGLGVPPVFGWSSYSLQAELQCSIGMSRNVADGVYVLVVTVFTTFLPLLLMLHSFICIMVTVKKKSVRVQDQPRGFNISYNRKVVTATLSAVRRVAVDMGFKTRSFKTILFLFLVLSVCWAPYSIWVMVKSVLGKDDSLSSTLLLCFCCLKSAINPVIYSARIQKFREACMGVLPTQCCSSPCIPMSVTRRVNPSSVYVVRDQSTSQ